MAKVYGPLIGVRWRIEAEWLDYSTALTMLEAIRGTGAVRSVFNGLDVNGDPLVRPGDFPEDDLDQFAAPEGSTLAGSARTEDQPPSVMSGGAEPAGAAKHHETKDVP